MREKLTDHVIPAGPDPRADLAEFAALADGRRLKRLAEATDRLLALPTEYGNIFLRVGRPVVREIGWYQGAGAGAGIGAAAAAGAVGSVVGLAVGGPAGHVLGAAAGHALGSVVGGAASSAAREAIHQSSNPVPRWWSAPVGQTAPASAPQPQSPTQMASQQPGASQAARDTYPVAAREFDRLVGIIGHVTAELEREFRTEAQRTVRVLAAATDLFLFSATGTPDVEVEFEKLCEPIQRELWPDAFAQATTKAAADLTVLQGKVAETQAAADPIAVRASRGRLF